MKSFALSKPHFPNVHIRLGLESITLVSENCQLSVNELKGFNLGKHMLVLRLLAYILGFSQLHAGNFLKRYEI